MASAVLGKVSPTPKGEYVSTQDYARLDVVTYEGYPYLAKSNVPSGNLPTDELYWMPLLVGLDFAPGGYGLGDEARELTNADNLNNIWRSGNYYWNWSTPANAYVFDWDTNGAYGYMRVDGENENVFTQTLRSHHAPNIGITMVRHRIGDTITPWVRCDPSAFAPSGYGLGVVTPEDVGTPDNALETGEYVVDDPDGGKGWLWCDSANAYYKHQTLFNISAGSSDGNRLSKKRERWMYAGIWQPWEWVNPPMTIGVEYRTTERWQGNVVYTMMVDCGAAANGKTTTPNIGAGTIFKFVGRTVGYALPMLHTGLSSTYMMYLYCDNNSVTIMCGSAMVGKQTYCQIWYYKD